MASRLTRREAIAGAGAGALGLGTGIYLVLRDGDGDGTDVPAPDPAASPSSGERACVLAPEQTEGPYYLDESLVRREIAEGRRGVPLELRLTVQDAASCDPIAGATVEIWHCDAEGGYSGFDGEDGAIYCRGAQRSGRDGEMRFRTIYPGWYQGRTPHIHLKVHAGGEEVHTGQLYFEDAASNAVYARAPYDSRGERSVTNASDGIYSSGGRESTLALERAGKGYVGRLALGVRSGDT